MFADELVIFLFPTIFMIANYILHRFTLLLAATAGWLFVAVYSYDKSTPGTWDLNYAMFFFGMVMFFICAWEIIVSSKKQEQNEEEESGEINQRERIKKLRSEIDASSGIPRESKYRMKSTIKQRRVNRSILRVEQRARAKMPQRRK